MRLMEFNWGHQAPVLKNTKAGFVEPTGDLVVETDLDYEGELSAVMTIVLRLPARPLKVVASVTIARLVGRVRSDCVSGVKFKSANYGA